MTGNWSEFPLTRRVTRFRVGSVDRAQIPIGQRRKSVETSLDAADTSVRATHGSVVASSGPTVRPKQSWLSQRDTHLRRFQNVYACEHRVFIALCWSTICFR